MERHNVETREKQMQDGGKWRARPTQGKDAKDYAVYKETDNLESFIRTNRSLNDQKAHLPIISRQSITKYR